MLIGLPQPVTRFLDRHENVLQLTVTAAAASAITATAILSYQARQRRSKSNALKHALLKEEETATFHHVELTPLGTIQQQAVDYDETLIQEQLARNIAFLGKDGVSRVRQAFVIVIGAGSVGSWGALMLLRSGVQHLRLIDPARVTRRTMANHAVAELEDIGLSKVDALHKHFREIAPFTKVECCTERLSLGVMGRLLDGHPDYVVDTMSNLDDKIALAQYCHVNGIKVISCMSTGAKADPTRIEIADVSDTMEDPMARAYRRRLKMLKIDRGIPVAFSIEKPVVAELLREEGPNNESVQDFRSRHLPSLGPIGSMLGMTIATHILLQLAEFAALPSQPIRIKDSFYNRIMHETGERETKFYNSPYPFTIHDVIYIVEEIWHGKSVISGPQDRLTLARWDRTKPLSYLNAVCMNRDEARAHDKLPSDIDLRHHYGDDVVDYVNKQFNIEGEFQKLWT